MKTIYLDNNATTQPTAAVRAAVEEAMREHWANPSSSHRAGQAVRHHVEQARGAVARLIHADPGEIVFTSGGTESANLAMHAARRARPGCPVVVTSRLEHAAVRDFLLRERGIEIVELPNDADGLIEVDALEQVLRERADAVALVSVMWCNNVTGVVQPVETVGDLCRSHGVPFHSDGTQWVGRMAADVGLFPLDMLSFAGHKFHGPKGTGVLWVRAGLRLAPLITGGPQERWRRGGTENVPGILGLGVAADQAGTWLDTCGSIEMAARRDKFERRILDAVPGARVHGGGAPRHWSTANIGFPGVEPDAMRMLLSERGVCVSGGSACSAGSLQGSHVLGARGEPPTAAADEPSSAIRFSLSRMTTEAELEAAAGIVVETVHVLWSMAPVPTAS